MTNHLTDAEIEMFWSRDLEGFQTSRMAEHISTCDDCRQRITASRRTKGHDRGIAFSLDESSWLRGEHFEYEDKRAYADGLAGVEERAIAEAHLSSCAACREELARFLDDRGANDSMLSVRHQREARKSAGSNHVSWRSREIWRPLGEVALILLVANAGFLVTRTETRRRLLEYFGPSGEATAETIAPIGPIAIKNQAASPGRSREEGSGETRVAPATEETRVTLSDHGHKVVVEPRITGLSGADEAQLETITHALIAEDIPLPAVVANLWGSEGALRGERVSPFDLLRPRREVVRDVRPTFRWAPLREASSYHVFIVDSKRAAVLSSGRLPADVTTWRPSASLTRGESYWWSVSATVRGEEVISPGPSEAEWKFCVLSTVEYQKLKRIEERTDSHLARGVLYARAGLISESERELQKLLDENAHSTTVRKLLERVRSWR